MKEERVYIQKSDGGKWRWVTAEGMPFYGDWLDIASADSFFRLIGQQFDLDIQVVPQAFVECPHCGGRAVRRTLRAQTAVYTDEYEDDGWRAVETIELEPGFTLDCSACGFGDAEPPTY